VMTGAVGHYFEGCFLCVLHNTTLFFFFSLLFLSFFIFTTLFLFWTNAARSTDFPVKQKIPVRSI